MAKNNMTKKTKKQMPVAPRPRPPRGKKSAYEAAIADPFSSRAVGAKVPDWDSRYSASWRSSEFLNVTTDTYGYACTVVRFSNPGILYTRTSSNAGGTFNLNAGADGSWSDSLNVLASSDSAAVAVRPVAGGVKLVPLVNSTTATGRVYVVPMEEHSIIRWKNNVVGYSESVFRRAQGSKTYSLNGLVDSPKVVFTASPCDPTCHVYVPTSTSYVNGAFGSFANMIGVAIVVVGAPASTTVLDLEVIGHWEFLPGMAYEGLAGQAESYNPGVMERVANYLVNNEAVRYYATSAIETFFNTTRAPLRLTSA